MKANKRRGVLSFIFFCFIIIALIFSFSSSALAQQRERAGEEPRIKIGAFEIHPSLEVEQVYDDNIFLESTNEQHDLITLTRPGIQFFLPIRDHSLDLGYFAELSVFSDNSQENYQNQTLNAGGNLNFPGGLYFEVRDIYRDTTDPSSSAEQSDLDPRTRKKMNTVLSTLGYKLGEKSTAELGFSYYTLDYEDTNYDNLDRSEVTGRGTYFYKFWPKASILFEFVHSSNMFDQLAKTDPQDDSKAYEINTGLRFDPDAKLRGDVRVGYERRDFETIDDDDNLVFSAGLTWLPTPKFTGRISFSRSIENSESSTDEFYRHNQVSVGVTHKFTDKLYGSVDFTYYKDDYNTDREDENAVEVVEAGYYFKEWLRVFVKYERQDLDSTINLNDYEDNRVSFGIAMTY